MGALSARSAILLAAVFAASPGNAPSAGFDCARAEGWAEELVCADDVLAALDREATRLFAALRDSGGLTARARRELVAGEQEWRAARDDCWTAPRVRACVRASYAFRIHTLLRSYPEARGGSGAGISSGPFLIACPGFETLLSLTYLATEPRLSVLEWRDRFLLMTRAGAGSGERYVDETEAGEVAMAIDASEAVLEMPGAPPLRCQVRAPG